MSESPASSRLDQHLRLRLADLPDRVFEQFFLHFLNAGIRLVVERNGERIERRIIEANSYAAGSGRADKGVDLIAKVEGGETWAFQCKRVKNWDVKKCATVVQKATYPAQHYFLLVACDPHQDVQDFMAQFPNWSFWNLERICQEFRLRVPSHQQAKVLQLFLSPEELRRFVPFANEALVTASEHFRVADSSSERLFIHRFRLVGRKREVAVLRRFIADRTAKVLTISAKGGEGKSRLLWELASVLAGDDSPEVRFLNPRALGDLVLENWNHDRARVIVVDDAHRLERLSPELFALVRMGTATKLVLATRPQGAEAISELLRDEGFTDAVRLDLSQLKSKDQLALATEALGPERSSLAKNLIQRAGRNPFLVVLAGDQIRRGKLRWMDWPSDREFRGKVFRCFETENLDHLSEHDRKHSARLLRLLALVAPVSADTVFNGRAATCLDVPENDIEDLLHRLQAVGLVASETRDVRVLPDLFADFLVFDTVYGAGRSRPGFARAIFDRFLDQSAAIVRNVAESAWVASLESISRAELLRPVLETEFARIDSERTSFFECGQVIEHWSTFSVFLAGEALELARRVMARRTAPRLTVGHWIVDDEQDGIDSRWAMLSNLPALLRPIALWREDCREDALDLLWTLGVTTTRGILTGGDNHPWSVIGDATAFAARKPPQVSLAVLDWIDRLVQRDEVRRVIEENRSVLGTLLAPCFARFVHFSEWEGRSLRWWDQSVSVAATMPVRDRALAILARIIDQDSWRLALDAVRALKSAQSPVTRAESVSVRNVEVLREEWRPEREKALALLGRAVERHNHPVLRFSVRQMLLRSIAYDDDLLFKSQAAAVLATIPEDLDIRLLSAVLSQGYFEFAAEIGAPSGTEKQKIIRERWRERLREVGSQWLAADATPGAAVTRLERLTAESVVAGHSPNLGEFLPVVARTSPAAAESLVRAFLNEERAPHIVGAWHHLLFGIKDDEALVWTLLREAAADSRTAVRRGVIDYFCFRDRKEMILNNEEKALLEGMAANAGSDEVMAFVQLVKWTGPTCASWGFELLRMLPLSEMAQDRSGEVLAALNPLHAPEVVPPIETVAHVLDALVGVPEVDVDHFGGGYERIRDLYPRAVYNFVLKRIAHAEESGGSRRYQALPRNVIEPGFRLRLGEDPEFPQICAYLWEKTNQPEPSPARQIWRELFQGIAMGEAEVWLPQLIAAVKVAETLDALRETLDVIHFHGSLVVFRRPELTTAALQRARDLDGTRGYEWMRSTLYVFSGPLVRGSSNGELDSNSDYLEAEALKAAATYAMDPILGPFFRWIAERERHEREEDRRRHQRDLMNWDD